MAKKSPPKPPRCGCVSARARDVVIAASIALPPRFNTSTPSLQNERQASVGRGQSDSVIIKTDMWRVLNSNPTGATINFVFMSFGLCFIPRGCGFVGPLGRGLPGRDYA